MEMLTSKEYAKLISETLEEKYRREAYEANLIEMGKRSAYEIENAYIEGQKDMIHKLSVCMEIMRTEDKIALTLNDLEDILAMLNESVGICNE